MNAPGPAQPPLAPSQTEPSLLCLRSIQKAFGEKQVLRDVSFDVPKGEIVSILGRSGTGKSVLLRCIVGLHTPDAGEILYEGKNVTHPECRKSLRRASSYVFQHNALFDSATVLENMLLPMRAHGALHPAKQQEHAMALLRQMELEEAANRHPAQLSGGMQKRLAVARALVTGPNLVFFDEPTAGLDPIRRNAVFEMIATLQKQRGFTAVIVTHDVQEALLVSSRIVWLDEGLVAFDGAPTEFAARQEPRFCEFRDNLEALRQTLNRLETIV